MASFPCLFLSRALAPVAISNITLPLVISKVGKLSSIEGGLLFSRVFTLALKLGKEEGEVIEEDLAPNYPSEEFFYPPA